VRAAQLAESVLDEALETASEMTMNAFGYHDIPDAKAKCVRDMGFVLRHSIAAMLHDDPAILESRLLSWLTPVLHSRKFPGGGLSIQSAYNILRQEVLARLDPVSQELLGPYLDLAVAHLTGSGKES
jgi:hypothetical protein